MSYSDEAYTNMPNDHHVNAHSLELNVLLLNGLRDPHVRRLAWSTLSGSLLKPSTNGQSAAGNLQHSLYQSAFALDTNTRNLLFKGFVEDQDLLTQWIEHLIELDQAPALLLDPINRPECKRLGRYFEQLWLYFFDWHRDISILCANQQLNIVDPKASSKRRTLGEIDALILHQQSPQRALHIEMAIKFYLHLPNGRWIGPNQKDFLDRKLDHLLTHQLKLSQHPQLASVYPTLSISEGLLISGLLCKALQELPKHSGGLQDSFAKLLNRPWGQPRVGFWGTKEEWRTATENIKIESIFANDYPLWQHIQPLTNKRDWLGASILDRSDINKEWCHSFENRFFKTSSAETMPTIDQPQMLGIRFPSALGTQCLPIGFCVHQDFCTKASRTKAF